MRWLLAVFFVGAGYAHLTVPEKLLSITPDWVPYAAQIIFVTGWLEFAGALALVTTPLRKPAALAMALYTLCVWPANIKHAVDGIALAGLPSSWWYHGPRLALQPVIIWAVLYAGEVIRWPFGARRS